MLRAGVFAAAIVGMVFSGSAAIAGDTNWSGLYIGAHAGYGWADWDGKLDTTAGCYPENCPGTQSSAGYMDPFKTLSDKGWLGGAQIGYNIQREKWVVGFEADISWADIDASGTFDTDHPWFYSNIVQRPSFRKKHDLSLDAFGTARVRAGYAHGSLLPYLTGGLAWAKTDGDIGVSYPAELRFKELGYTGVPGWYNSTTRGSVDETHIGWTIGGGLEWKLARGFSIKAEYLYVDLGKEKYLFEGPPVDATGFQPFNTDSFTSDLNLQTIRVGLNYNFGTHDDPAPLK